MLGPGWFYDENGNLMHKDDVGVPNPGEGPRARPPITRPATSLRQPLRKIGGNPNGTWESIKTWWLSLKPEHRYGIVAAPFLVGVIIAAVQGKGKDSTVKKI